MRMMVRVPSAAVSPEEDRPKQQQQRDQPDRAQGNNPPEGGKIQESPKGPYLVSFRGGQEKCKAAHAKGPFPSETVVSSSVSVPKAIFKRCIR